MEQYGNHASDDCQQYQITSYDFVCNEIPLSFLIRLMIKIPEGCGGAVFRDVSNLDVTPTRYPVVHRMHSGLL